MKVQKYTYILLVTLCLLLIITNAVALTNVTATAQDRAVNASTSYLVQFTTDSSIYKNGNIRLIFPSSFDISQVLIATSENQTTMDGQLEIDSLHYKESADPDTIWIGRVGAVDIVEAESTVKILISVVGNPSIAGNYNIDVQTLTAVYVLRDSGTSDSFSIIPVTPIKSFTLTATPKTSEAGQGFDLIVSNALDEFNNPGSGIIDISFNDGQDHKAPDENTEPVLPPIVVSSGTGTARQVLYKAESGVVLKGVVRDNVDITNVTTVNISPSVLQSFKIEGFPEADTAGTKFTKPVIVTALDPWQNIKTDFSESVYFTSSDAAAVLTYDAGNSTSLSNGVTTLSGSHFELRTIPYQTITVNGGGKQKTSEPIFVNAAAINNFSLNVGTTQQAGQPFNLFVQGAKDAFGNKASGTAIVFLDVNNHDAPNEQAPLLNDIIVDDEGNGYAKQILFKAETTQLRGQSGAFITNTSNITVLPGALNRFDMSGTPTNTVPGQTFTSPVKLDVFDAYSNPKTNYTGTISFSSSDPSATLPSDYTYVNESTHSFPGSQFALVTPGGQKIIAKDQAANKSDTSSVVHVNSIRIVQISSAETVISQGQLNIPVIMRVENQSDQTLIDIQAGLLFKTGIPVTDYTSSPATLSALAPGQTADLNFLVNVANNATIGNVTIDGSVQADINGLTVTDAESDLTHQWTVNYSSEITINSVKANADTVSQGSSNSVTTNLSNRELFNNTARAVDLDHQFVFKRGTTDVSSSFTVTSDPIINLSVLEGGARQTFTFFLNIDNEAPLGKIYISNIVNYTDEISGLEKTTTSSPIDSFIVVPQSQLSITKVVTSQDFVTQNQDSMWAVRVAVKNEGFVASQLSFDNAETFILFKSGNMDYTNSFQIEYPTTFEAGGSTLGSGQTDSLIFKINKTTSQLGNLSIIAEVTSTTGENTNSNKDGIFSGIVVQTPDNLQIENIISSQQSVVKDDTTQHWFVDVGLLNNGGSEVSLDFAETNLVLSDTTGFRYLKPTTLKSGGTSLAGGVRDTLVYEFIKSGSILGSIDINSRINYSVNNTSEKKVKQSTLSIPVVVQAPSDFKIVNVRASQEAVTAGSSPNWHVAVNVANEGGSDVEINLNDVDSSWVRTFLNDQVQNDFTFTWPTALSGSGDLLLGAGQTDSLLFPVLTASPNLGDYFARARVQVTELNRNKTFSDSTFDTRQDTFAVQSVGVLSYVNSSLGPGIVSPSSNVQFKIAVENSGGSTINLDPGQTKIQFTDGSINFIAFLDPSFPTDIPSGQQTNVFFRRSFVSTQMLPGSYNPQVFFVGTENGNPYNLEAFLDDQVTVGKEGEVVISSLTPQQKTVTIGQTKNWVLDIGIDNQGVSPAKLDSAEIVFYDNTQEVSNHFIVHPAPDTLTSGRQYLTNGKSGTISITVDSVSLNAPLGKILLSAKVFMSDSIETSRQFIASANNLNDITVQQPALLVVDKFTVSQSFVTRGQTEPWYVALHVKNEGQSTLKIDTTSTKTVLSYNKPDSLFNVTTSRVFTGSGTELLAGGESDSVLFSINKVNAASALLGPVSLHSILTTTESNTDRVVSGTTQTTTGPISVTVQDSAQIRIDSLYVAVPSGSNVNKGQLFYVKANVSNPAGLNADDVNNVNLFVSSTNPSVLFPDGNTLKVDSIGQGQNKTSRPGILVRAPNTNLSDVLLTAKILNSKSRNTNNNAIHVTSRAAEDTTAIFNVQNPAILDFQEIIIASETIPSGTPNPWEIKLAVKNSGQAAILLDLPSVTINSEGYVIKPADQPWGHDSLLVEGELDTITYVVTTTPSKGGVFEITAKTYGIDQNDTTNVFVETRKRSFNVETSSVASINRTYIDAVENRVSENGFGHVNTNQVFNLWVEVKNEGAQNLDSLWLRAFSQTSVLLENSKTITNLKIGEKRPVSFAVRADAVENLSGELFSTKIDSARGIDGTLGRIDTGLDTTANVLIYKPAQLEIVSTKNSSQNNNRISYGQQFNISVGLANRGSEPVNSVSLGLKAGVDTLANILTTPLLIDGEIAADDTQFVTFNLQAFNKTGFSGFSSFIENAVGLNSKLPVDNIIDPGLQDTTFIAFEQGAGLVVESVTPSVLEINAGARQNWTIDVVVSNPGKADLELSDISASNIKIQVDGKIDTDYKINPPTELLKAGDFKIAGGASDTLVYSITKNGEAAGAATIDVRIDGYDKNVGPEGILSNAGSASVFVISDALVQIIQTAIGSGVYDGDGYGMVNRGQTFQVRVKVRSGELVGVDSVKVVLSTNGNSAIANNTYVIPHLDEDDKKEAMFSILADDTWSASLGEKEEQFSAQIIRAISPSSALPAEIRAPINVRDSLLVVRIQNPANVSLLLSAQNPADTVNTKSQIFNVLAKVTNSGTAWVDSGEVEIELPTGYSVAGGSERKPFSIINDSTLATIPFLIQAPDISLPKRNIRAFFSKVPKEKNTGNNAQIANAESFLSVQTVDSTLEILSFSIDSPLGARDNVISTEQSFTLKATIQASGDLRDRVARLVLPAEVIYKAVDPLEQAIVNESEILYWTIKAPEKAFPSLHVFNLIVEAKTVQGAKVSVEETVTIDHVDKKATLLLETLAVTIPSNVMEEDGAHLSTDQSFTIRTRVENIGTAAVEGEGRIRLDMRGNSNFTFFNNDEEKTFTTGEYIEWNLRAPENQLLSHTIRALVLPPTSAPRPEDINTNQVAEFTIDERELTLHIEDRGQVVINNVWISSPPGAADNILSSAQNFTVAAEISSEKTTNLLARIHFSNESFKASVEDIFGIPDNNIEKRIFWDVTAPDDAGVKPDSIWIEILYKDQASQDNLNTVSDKIGVSVISKTSFSLTPELLYKSPFGLNLRKQVSTGQDFTIMTRIRHFGAPFISSDSFVVELADMPAEFDIAPSETLEKTVHAESINAGIFPSWNFTAPVEKPDEPGVFVFSFKEVPRDSNSWVQGVIPNQEDDIEITTVDKASISLLPSLGISTGIDSGSVRIGTTFPVSVSLVNLGDAGFEDSYTVRLELPQSGLFTTEDNLEKTGDNVLVWTLQSPVEILNKPDTVKFTIITPPNDRNTKSPAFINKTSGQILLTTEAGILVAKSYPVQAQNAILKGGTNIPILGLVLRNKDIANATRSVLKSVRLQFKNRKRVPISPATVITRLAAVSSSNPLDVLGEVTSFGNSSNINLSFTKFDTIKGTTPDSVRFFVDISAGAENLNFQISIDSASAFQVTDISGNPILIADSTAVPKSFLGIQSRFSVLVENDLKNSFYTYPNPFGRSDRPVAKFLYVLKQPGDVSIRLFTLTGELVKTWEYTKTEHPAQTSEGLHQGEIVWDGLNGAGRTVMNGVYLAYITTEQGETAVTKIAFVK